MNTKLTLLLVVVSLQLLEAQFIKEKAINAQIGFGVTYPYNSVDNIASVGFFVQGQFVLKVKTWFELRPYLGFISTSSDGKDLNDNPTNEKAETIAVLLGGKVRIKAPIPWVAPYLELGVGASIGRFETLTVFDRVNKSGLIYHTPISLGLELGRNNSVDLGIMAYRQPRARQYISALALGISIPLNN